MEGFGVDAHPQASSDHEDEDKDMHLLQEILKNLLELTTVTQQLEVQQQTLQREIEILQLQQGAPQQPQQTQHPQQPQQTQPPTRLSNVFQTQSIQHQKDLREQLPSSLQNPSQLHPSPQQEVIPGPGSKLTFRVDGEDRLPSPPHSPASFTSEGGQFSPCVVEDATKPFVVLRPIRTASFPGWGAMPIAGNNAAHLLCGYTAVRTASLPLYLPTNHDFGLLLFLFSG